ncbi:DEAD/DEAH box helicase [Algiphilus sp.]|uniref:DEAD/DEAH box helicase n=1 Tax=Algiphilus sp. TaxID=1872431 RepID=UPI0025B8CA40|nr:DEAD/DEAH box helicase [Algiphilus sp.]MCK5768922.1 DEAD/DEAH box helicase [Algiphilus sp.]
MPFSSLGLGAALTRNCAEAGYTAPTPIQARAIPEILAGRDLIACAQTGTGKTAAFVLPLLQRLSSEPAPSGARTPRALVLAPTRELAAQIAASARASGAGLNVRNLAVFGGVSPRPQSQALARGIDLLVATPGRLLDLHAQGAVKLSAVRHVVLDEADRMLDMGFIHDLRRILKLLPEVRQTMLFSATFADDVRALAERFLREPAEVSITPEMPASEGVAQHSIRVPRAHKRALLAWLIGQHPEWDRVLVFARTKHGADKVARQLSADGIPAAPLHGGKSQGARTRVLDAFRGGTTRVLVATDVAGRGIDVPLLPSVINFDLPNVPEDYVHRIGRTARAGATGVAIALVTPEDVEHLQRVERHLGRKLPAYDVAGFAPPASAPAEQPAPGAGKKAAPRPGSGSKPRSRGNQGKPGAARKSGRGGQRRDGGGQKPRARSGGRRQGGGRGQG